MKGKAGVRSLLDVLGVNYTEPELNALTGALEARRWAEPTYAGDWLRAWDRVLATCPHRTSAPRVDVLPGRSELGCRGLYDPIGGHRHHGVVSVWPDMSEDRWDALDTLVHELAHAWCPVERSDHGPKWLATYCAIYSWLIGEQFDVVESMTRFDALPADDRRALSGLGRGMSLRRCLAHAFYVAQLRALEPQVLVRVSAPHTHVVVLTPGDHPRHRVVLDHATQTASQVPHGSPEV